MPVEEPVPVEEPMPVEEPEPLMNGMMPENNDPSLFVFEPVLVPEAPVFARSPKLKSSRPWRFSFWEP